MDRSAERYAQLQAIFRESRALAGPARSKLLDQRCGGDTALRQEAEALLASVETERRDVFSEDAIDAARGALVEMLSADSADLGTGEHPGDVIDRYRLVELLGEGGMGSVWRAEQQEPVRRQVALKIIKLGMDTREVVARFEAERQALAMMDHPHIAKVYDGGATTKGRPYFVMELVAGTPITDYCDQQRLGLRDRLRLFGAVCQALQHAHQRGLIHRDIKPSNVLVACQDGVAVPKVIDFGIAKATSAELTQRTLFTQQAQILGTPAYMAPEQADLGKLDVDTRADVYALGVMLYELLTGTRPFDVQQALMKGFDELLRTIREEEPQRPSTRVSTLKATATAVSVNRHVDVDTLSAHLRGDLDWIVMKALEKERDRRYPSASSFAADIERYLRDEPVEAVPPSRVYRLRKLMRRRKKTVIATTIIAALFLAGSIGTGVGLWKTHRANRALERALKEKSDALLAEEHQRRLAATRAAELQQVADFRSRELSNVDVEQMGIRLRSNLLDAIPLDRRDALAAALEPVNFTTQALDALRANLFDGTLAAIHAEFQGQPLVRAQLLQSMATSLRELGLLEAAVEPQQVALTIRRAELADDHLDTLESVTSLGLLQLRLGNLTECEARFTEAYQGTLRLLGPDHDLTLRSLANVASALHAQQRYAEAEEVRRRLVDDRRGLGLDHDESMVQVLDGLASSIQEQSRLSEAATWFHEALSLSREVLGDDHRDTLIALHNLGAQLRMQGLISDAEPLLREALAGHRRVYGDDHPATMTTVASVGWICMVNGKLEEAEALFREALTTRERVLGEGHQVTLISLGQLGMVLMSEQRFEEAEPYLKRALVLSRRLLGDGHRGTVAAINNLGGLYRTLGRLDEAEPYLIEALEGARLVFGPDHPNTLRSLINVGGLLRDQGKLAEAEPYYEQAWEGRRRVMGEDNPETQLARDLLQALRERLAAGNSGSDGD